MENISKYLGQIAVVLICGFLTWFAVAIQSMAVDVARMSERLESLTEKDKVTDTRQDKEINSIKERLREGGL